MKKIISIGCTVAVLAFALWVWNNTRVGTEKKISYLEKQVMQAEKKEAAAAARAREADDDNGLLIAALKNTAPKNAQTIESAAKAPERQMITQRRAAGRAKLVQGDFQGALDDLLWCYEATKTSDTITQHVRDKTFLPDLVKLAQTYEPARQALIARRDKLSAELETNGRIDEISTAEFASINHGLSDGISTVRKFESLPETSEARGVLVKTALSDFVAARKYTEVTGAVSFSEMSEQLQRSTTAQQMYASQSPSLQTQYRDSTIQSTLDNIEALAGAGQFDHAKELSAKLLGYDKQESTVTSLQDRLIRAGQPALINSITTTKEPAF